MSATGLTAGTAFQPSMTQGVSVGWLTRGVCRCPALLRTSPGTPLTLGPSTSCSTAQNMSLLEVGQSNLKQYKSILHCCTCSRLIKSPSCVNAKGIAFSFLVFLSWTFGLKKAVAVYNGRLQTVCTGQLLLHLAGAGQHTRHVTQACSFLRLAAIISLVKLMIQRRGCRLGCKLRCLPSC